MDYVPRRILSKFKLFLDTFPAVMIVGPRQCGKSTFVRREIPTYRHLDLERPADFSLITADPELFFDEHPRQVCIDEAQRYPQLFPVLRHVIDRQRTNGSFVLLGSAGGSLLNTVSESLTGRVGILELTGFTSQELRGIVPWQERWWLGGLPPLFGLTSAQQRAAWIESYTSTLLERDLPLLGVRVPSPRLRRLWTMLTHLQGELLNVSALAQSLELSTTAVYHYLDILEGAFMITRLPPYFANVGKRLVKSPKVFIRDTGILHRLAGLRAPGDLESWINRGRSFEGLVVEELMAAARLELDAPQFFFWRTQAGAEVDLLIQQGGRITPVEIKLGTVVSHYDTAGLRQCMKDLSLPTGFIITRSQEVRAIGGGITIIPWEAVARGEIYPWSG